VKKGLEMTIHYLEDTIQPSMTVSSYDQDFNYRYLSKLKGRWITLIAGDFTIEGWVVDVKRPDFTTDYPDPIITIDTGYDIITGSVISGDIVIVPLTSAKETR